MAVHVKTHLSIAYYSIPLKPQAKSWGFIFKEMPMADKIISMSQVNVGEFIKFTDKDKNGKFSYIGEVISIVDGWINILTFDGEFGFLIDKQNDLETVATTPVGWKKYKADPEAYRMAVNLEKIKKNQTEVLALKSMRDKVSDFVKGSKEKSLDKLFTKASKVFTDVDPKVLRNYVQLALMRNS